jgi:sporulation protein YlmC with PRC-barrel domain
MLRLSELFGRDIFTQSGDYKGKVYDIVVNLETGVLETITTAPLKVKTKLEAKKIMSEKSIPYRSVIAVKDIIIVNPKASREVREEAPAPKKVSSGALVKYR